MDDVKRGPEWIGRHVCVRQSCSGTAEVDTEIGPVCRSHAQPLMFSVQSPYRVHDGCPREIPWEMVRPHERQARRNHGGQTLARLSERGGLSASETVAVLEGREWHDMPRQEAVSRLRQLLGEWEAERGRESARARWPHVRTMEDWRTEDERLRAAHDGAEKRAREAAAERDSLQAAREHLAILYGECSERDP
ncbi:MAG: hypothetical protein BWY99_02136 [Synergistetes bacterium ADurb.BinA166]|nr:MAG: hypothetical protein BWY99_02136 [Synergistetes bacterium ADurb.BinA166]